MKKKIIIEGMSCGHCTGRVEKALLATDGVEAVQMDLASKSALVQLSQEISDDALIALVDDAGYEVIEITNQ